MYKNKIYAKFNIKGGENILKQISLKNYKNIVGTFKESIEEKMLKKKIGDELYMQYVKNAIQEAEEHLANGGKTYTLEEWQELMRERYGADI